MGKAEIVAAEEIYRAAKESAEIEIARMREELEAVREESKAIGALKKIEYDAAHNQMLKYAILWQIKKNKDYRKGGLSWEAFCEAVGEERSTVDRIINDMKPIYDDFSLKLTDFLGMPFAKIRYLGKSLKEDGARIDDGCLVIDGSRIPLTPESRDDIEAAIDAIKESHARTVEMHTATIKAKDRIMDEKERVIRNQEKELEKIKKQLSARGFSPEEETFFSDLDRVKNVLTGALLQLDPRNMPAEPEFSTFMRAAYLETLNFCRRTICGYYDDADLEFGGGVTDNDEWVQPDLRVVDN